VAVILVLVTALVGPFFVDWTLYRSTFETYAERVLGHKVTVLGEADLQLLPAPTITFSDVRVGEAEDPLLVVSQFRMRIELPPLMKGEFKVQDLTLDEPRLQLSLDEQGRLDWLTAQTSDGMLARLQPDDVAFEKVTVTDGAVSIIDARSGQTVAVDQGSFSISARSLAGPFRLDGSLAHDGVPYTVQLASGRLLEDGNIRVKGHLTPSVLPVDLSFDGMLTHENAAPVYDGTFELASIPVSDEMENRWVVSGEFEADVERLDVRSFEYVFNPEERRLSAAGSANLVYSGDQRFSVRAGVKQLDLDRLLGGGPTAPVEIDAASVKLLNVLRSLPRPNMDGVISLDVPAVVLGGALVQELRLDLETMLGGWRVARLAGRAPGRTVIATQGDLGLSPDLTYRGNLSFASAQPGTFLNWLVPAEGPVAPLDPVELDGRLNIIPGGVSLDGLRVTLADAEAQGELAYQERTGQPPLFSMSLGADRLDMDALTEIAAAFNQRRPDLRGTEDPSQDGAAGLDVNLRIRADQVAAAGVEGERLAVEAQYSGGDLTIERLYTADLAGAEIDAEGQVKDLFGAPDGQLRGALVAESLTGLVQLLRTAFPDEAIFEQLEFAAPHLVPARLNASLEAQAGGDGNTLNIGLQGTAAQTTLTMSAGLQGQTDDWRAADVSVDLQMGSENGGNLLRQFGFPLLPVDDLGAGGVTLTLSGQPSSAMDLALSASSEAGKVGARGMIRLPEGEDTEYDITVSAETDDLTPIALLFGRVLPVMAGDIPASISAEVSGAGSEVAITDLKGNFAGTDVTGSLSGDLQPLPGETNRRFTGQLKLEQADLRVLSETVLGPDQWFAAGDGSSVWPTAAFGAPLLSSTDVTLDLQAGTLAAGDLFGLSNAQAELRMTPNMMRLDRLIGTFANGSATGALTVERSGPQAAVSGRLQFEDADMRRLSWRREGRPVATGSLDLFVEFEGAGRSISGIVSTLGGGGTFSVADGELRGLNANAFDLVLRAVDAGLELEDDRIAEAFVSHLDAGVLPFSRLEGAIGLVGGRVTARNVVVDAEAADVFGSAEADLNTFELDSDFSVRVDPGENAVTGAEPQVGLLFQGVIDDPDRQVDVTPFTAYLTLRAFEREVERVERLQAEILERDRLVREMRRLREDQRRAEREAEAAAQAAEEAASEEAASSQDLDNAANTPVNEPAGGADEETRNEAAQSSEPQEEPLQSTDFADSIRSILEVEAANDNRSGAALPVPEPGPGPGRAGADLPPLDAPQTIGELLENTGEASLSTQDFGTSTGQVGGSDIGTGRPVVLPRPERAVQPARPTVPRYITLPSGLVMENPEWPGG